MVQFFFEKGGLLGNKKYLTFRKERAVIGLVLMQGRVCARRFYELVGCI